MTKFTKELIGLSPLSALAQQTTAQDSLLDRMVGKWVLQGTIAGSETTHDIIMEWVLGHQYVQLKEVSHEKDMNGNPLYEAIVFICWEQKLNQYSCLWLDNTGNGGLSTQAVGHAKAKQKEKIQILPNMLKTGLKNRQNRIKSYLPTKLYEKCLKTG